MKEVVIYLEQAFSSSKLQKIYIILLSHLPLSCQYASPEVLDGQRASELIFSSQWWSDSAF